MQVGVIGNGFVGNAIYQNFKDKVLTKVFDVKQEKRLNELSDVLGSDIIFICLPTPMKETGECDLSYVDDFLTIWIKVQKILKTTHCLSLNLPCLLVQQKNYAENILSE